MGNPRGSVPWESWADGEWHQLVEGGDFESERAIRSGASRWARRRRMTAQIRADRLTATERAGGVPRVLRIRFEGEGLADLPRVERVWVQLGLFPLRSVQLAARPARLNSPAQPPERRTLGATLRA